MAQLPKGPPPRASFENWACHPVREGGEGRGEAGQAQVTQTATPSASAWGPAKQLLFIALFLFSWSQCWIAVGTNLWHIANTPSYRKTPDVKFTAPLAVLLVGLLATNLFGFLAFTRSKQPLEAGLALIGLDSPYVVSSRGLRILRGEKVVEWQELQWRKGLWLSLPLACLKLWMMLRVYVEIPGCQVLLRPSIYLSAVDGSAPPPGGIQESLNGTWQQLSLVDATHRVMQKNAELYHTLQNRLQDGFVRDARSELESLWHSWHCEESDWTVIPMADMTARREYYFPSTDTRPEDSVEPPGQIGSGHMGALNEHFRQQLIAVLNEDRELIPKVTKISKKLRGVRAFVARTALRLLPQETVIYLVMEKLRANMKQSYKDADAIRGWSANAPHQSRPYLGWMLFSSVMLMLNASRSLSAKFCQVLDLELATSLAVTVHGVVDVTLMVITLLLASAAQQADKQGKVVRGLPGAMEAFYARFLEMITPEDFEGGSDHFDKLVVKAVGDFLSTKAPGILHDVLEERFVDIVAITPDQLALITLGILLFMLASTTLAGLLVACTTAPKPPLNALLDVGLTGPLRLLMDARHKNIQKLGVVIPLQIVLRGVLCGLFVKAAWCFVDEEYIASSYAMVFNDDVENNQVSRLYTALVLLHIGSGLIAYCMIYSATSEPTGDLQQVACLHKPS